MYPQTFTFVYVLMKIPYSFYLSHGQRLAYKHNKTKSYEFYPRSINIYRIRERASLFQKLFKRRKIQVFLFVNSKYYDILTYN